MTHSQSYWSNLFKDSLRLRGASSSREHPVAGDRTATCRIFPTLCNFSAYSCSPPKELSRTRRANAFETTGQILDYVTFKHLIWRVRVYNIEHAYNRHSNISTSSSWRLQLQINMPRQLSFWSNICLCVHACVCVRACVCVCACVFLHFYIQQIHAHSHT
jgi:hypothetical protein